MLLPRSLSHNYATNELAAIGRFFSAAVVREMGRWGRSPLLARLAKESSLPSLLDQTQPIRRLFDVAFSILRQSRFRDEYVYKAALTHKILLSRHSLRTAVMLTEFRVGSNKADVVILNGTSTVYEIKSERDSLKRLQGQVTAYRDMFANVNVICGENHLDSVLNGTTADIGVLVLADDFRITTIREALNTPGRINPVTIFESLQLCEAKETLKQLGLTPACVPNTQLHRALREQFEGLDPTAVHSAMVRILRRTRTLLPLDQLLQDLPSSLRAAACSTTLRKGEPARLLQAIETPLHQALAWG